LRELVEQLPGPSDQSLLWQTASQSIPFRFPL